jgi:hypothetical protein
MLDMHYANKGLGCLLVMNVKEIFITEHLNLMTNIEVKSGNFNDPRFQLDVQLELAVDD